MIEYRSCFLRRFFGPIIMVACLALSACSSTLAQLPTARFERHSLDSLAPDTSSVKVPVSLPATRQLLAASQAQSIPPQPAEEKPAAAPLTQAADLIDLNAVNAPLDALLFALASDAGVQLSVRSACGYCNA